MAKEYYDQPITASTKWGGDGSTGGKQVKGSRVQEWIKGQVSDVRSVIDKVLVVTTFSVQQIAAANSIEGSLREALMALRENANKNKLVMFPVDSGSNVTGYVTATVLNAGSSFAMQYVYNGYLWTLNANPTDVWTATKTDIVNVTRVYSDLTVGELTGNSISSATKAKLVALRQKEEGNVLVLINNGTLIPANISTYGSEFYMYFTVCDNYDDRYRTRMVEVKGSSDNEMWTSTVTELATEADINDIVSSIEDVKLQLSLVFGGFVDDVTLNNTAVGSEYLKIVYDTTRHMFFAVTMNGETERYHRQYDKFSVYNDGDFPNAHPYDGKLYVCDGKAYIGKDGDIVEAAPDTAIFKSGEKVGDVDINDYVKKDSVQDDLTAGLAKNLVDTKGDGTAQEILFRTSCGNDSTADDGNAVIKKVTGKTLVWNQQIVNGNFARGLTGWKASLATATVADGVCRVQYTCPAGQTSQPSVNQDVDVIPIVGHKYLLRFDIKRANSSPTQSNLSLRLGEQDSSYSIRLAADWETKSFFITAEDTSRLWIWGYNAAGESQVEYDWSMRRFLLVDLTKMFGAGNEPATVAEFEAMFPEHTYPYNSGELINVAPESIESVGFNLYDHSTRKARLVKPTGTADLLNGTNCYQITGAYTSLKDADGKGITPNASGFFAIDKDTEVTVTGGNGTTTCIHLTWSGYRNGEYEEYWKQVRDLDIKTATTNGVTPFADGLKSVGNTYDEATAAYGIKRIGQRAYQSGDESDATVVTDGTTTYYVLTTPEEYTWDEPLNWTYKVADFGTEAIAPTEDAQGNPVTLPLQARIKYNIDFVREVANLPEKYVAKSEAVKTVASDDPASLLD